MSDSNTVTLLLPENPSWNPGTCPFTLSIGQDQGIAPTVKSTSDNIAKVTLDTTEGPNSTYNGTITATGTGTATLSYNIAGTDYILATAVVVEWNESGSVTLGTPTLPTPPSPKG